jgi:hypothetical protein
VLRDCEPEAALSTPLSPALSRRYVVRVHGGPTLKARNPGAAPLPWVEVAIETPAGWILDQAIWIRLAVMASLFGYLVIIWVTHFVPLPPFLTAPLALTGWLFLPGLFLLARLRRIDTRPSAQPPLGELLRPWALTATFGALAAVVLFLAIGWDVPSFCHGPVPVNCVKGYQWSTDNGHYYHSIEEGPQVEISQQTYVQEVGFDLRSAAVFGVLALCGAWVAAAVFRPANTRAISGR